MHGIYRGRVGAQRSVRSRARPGERALGVSYLEPGKRRRAWRPRPAAWLVLVLVTAVLASLVLLTQASAGEPGADCPHGAISAIGPVDADGRGDAVPETSCVEP
jgi:hypothetical protein